MKESEAPTIKCPVCGIEFAVSKDWVGQRERDHQSFFCPNGHGQYFPGETEDEKLRKENKRLREENLRLQSLLPHRDALGRFIKRKE